jgi:hypothetical protein
LPGAESETQQALSVVLFSLLKRSLLVLLYPVPQMPLAHPGKIYSRMDFEWQDLFLATRP